MSKVAFIWAKGTSYVFNWFGIAIPTEPKGDLHTIAGIDGNNSVWQGGDIEKQPILQLLDPGIFDIYNVDYPASLVPGEISLETGVEKVIATIQALPAGQPFILGGYSQGAAVNSLCYRQGLQTGTTGVLESYRSRFLGAIMYGNPMRAVNHRGAVGGTWSGSWDVPDSTTGGHGCYPSTGQFARLSSAESKWVEFVGLIDSFTCTGDSTKGQAFSSFTGNTLALGKGGILNALFELFGTLQFVSDPGGLPITSSSAAAVAEAISFNASQTPVIDGGGKAFMATGGGHAQYAWLPPPNSDGTFDVDEVEVDGVTYWKPAADTMYQVGVKYALSLAAEYARAPILLPSEPVTTASAGWSTTLIPPAA